METTPDIFVRTLAARTHGRYLVRHTKEPRGIVIGFHGYAQDASTLLDDVAGVPGLEAWTMVSVQALHPFYTRSGKIVASWMTSLDRELAIEDNRTYVAAIVGEVRSQESRTRLPLVFLGFSQGAAMAFRAAACIADCSGVIALGGDIPPEIRRADVRLPPVLLGRGRGDDWYTAEKMAADRAWLDSSGTDATISVHDGGHGWTDAFRTAAGAFLATIASEVVQD